MLPPPSSSLCSLPPTLSITKPSLKPKPKHSPSLTKCSLQAISTPPLSTNSSKPTAAEISRTVLELAKSGTLSAATEDGWPLGVGARFVADDRGAPALCIGMGNGLVGENGRSSFHVQFEQSGSRTPQCTLLGSLTKLTDELALKRLCTKWQKKFGEEIDQDLMYLISVERVFHMEDFKEDGVWVEPSEYISAEPDPLRNFAESIMEEMNTRHAVDVRRLCNVYVELDFEVTDTKMIWVDRLGFDLHIYSEEGVYAARIPLSREVVDEKGVKSSFNMMSHLAWEIEKNYVSPDFEKVKLLKRVR